MRNSCARATSSALGSLAAAIVAVALAARADSTIDFEASVPDTLYQQGYGSGQGAYLEDGFVIAEAAQGFWFMGANPERDAIGNGADGGCLPCQDPLESAAWTIASAPSCMASKVRAEARP